MLFSNGEINAMRSDLEVHGWIAVPVMTRLDAAQYATDLLDEMISRFGDLDKLLLYGSRQEGSAGIWEGFQNSDTVWKLRRLESVREVFHRVCFPQAPVLYPSVDRINFRSPSMKRTYGEWWHWDVDPAAISVSYQGFVTLRDDACLCILRNSHHNFPQLQADVQNLQVPPEDIKQYVDRFGVDRIRAPAGHLVIWNSKCLHTPWGNCTDRLLAYIKYSP